MMMMMMMMMIRNKKQLDGEEALEHQTAKRTNKTEQDIDILEEVVLRKVKMRNKYATAKALWIKCRNKLSKTQLCEIIWFLSFGQQNIQAYESEQNKTKHKTS